MMPEEVDVTELITSGNYLPDSCEGRINRLIRAKRATYQIDTLELKNILMKCAVENQIDTTRDLSFSMPEYQYTYIINKEPVDVYKIALTQKLPALNTNSLYFRIDNSGKFIPELSKDSWVISNCDK